MAQVATNLIASSGWTGYKEMVFTQKQAFMSLLKHQSSHSKLAKVKIVSLDEMKSTGRWDYGAECDSWPATAPTPTFIVSSLQSAMIRKKKPLICRRFDAIGYGTSTPLKEQLSSWIGTWSSRNAC